MTDPQQIVARTAWGEARGGGQIGIQSVCNVVMNRARHPRWWGSTPIEVCLKPWQFSCWNMNDPNRSKLLAVSASDADFAAALDLAAAALTGELPDITGGADSYYAAYLSTPPDWAANATFTAEVAGQLFYRVELPAPPGPDPAPST